MPTVGPSHRAIQSFLAVGLLPGLYAARRLPIGLWHMTWGWAWIIGAIALPGLAPVHRLPRVRRALAVFVVVSAVVGACAFVLYRLSLAEAKGQWLPAEGAVTGVAVALQALVAGAVLVLLRRQGVPRNEIVRAGSAMGSVLLAAVVLVPVGRSFPWPVLVVALAVAATRVALLPVDRSPARAGGWRFASQAILYAWAVAIIALETRVSTREGGFVVTIAALLVGLVVLIVLSSDGTFRRRLWLGPAVFGVGVGMAGGLAILVPSEQSAHWLHDWHFDTPSEFDLARERFEDGVLERWYDTRLSATETEQAAHEAFSFLVSEWPSLSAHGIDGHVWGYHLDVRIWDVRAELPSRRSCHAELRSCVLVVLRPSTA